MRKGRRKVEHGSAARRLPPGDAELVQRARSGEHRAFNELLERHQRRAVCAAYRLIGNVHDALEVSQDAFIRAYQSLPTLADGNRFGPWLLRIVTNLALNFRRARRPRRERQRQWPRGNIEGAELAQSRNGRGDRPSSAMNTLELAQRIEAGLAELPEQQRAALVLFSVEQIPQKEVARMLGCSVEAVKWHVFQARRKLKTRLKDYL